LLARADIDRVLAANPILPLAQQYLPHLKRSGRQWFTLCPIHKERSPSFSVNPDNGLYHCHGCKIGGNAIDLVMLLERISFPAAVRLLADRAGISLQDKPNSSKDAYVAQLAAEAAWYWSEVRRRYTFRESMMVTLRNRPHQTEDEYWLRHRYARSAARWHNIITRLDSASPGALFARYLGIRQRHPEVVTAYRRHLEEERAWRKDWEGWMVRLRQSDDVPRPQVGR
jgi:hypothetical protein